MFDILHINLFSQESYLHDLMAQKLVFMILSSADIAVHYVKFNRCTIQRTQQFQGTGEICEVC